MSSIELEHYPHREQLTVRFDEEQLIAFLKYHASIVVENPLGEKVSDLGELTSFLRDNGVDYGIYDQALQDFLENPTNYRDREIAVAYGDEPQHGENARLELDFQLGQKRVKEENGRVNFFEIQEIPNVTEGQKLATYIPPTKGIPGRSVKGDEIPAKDGNEQLPKLGKNVVFDPNQKALFSTITGQVSIISDKIHVFPNYEVHGDLDLNTGNIDFVGSVIIRGNVPSNFKIKAGGDVRVWGSVEGAEIEAGGSVFIHAGVNAQHKGHIHAEEDFHAIYLNNANVQAKKSVYIKQAIMHSHVNAGENIECMGDKGLVVGGELHAGRIVVCRNLGNPMTTATHVTVGHNPQLAETLSTIIHQIKEYEETINKSNQAIQVLERLHQQGGLNQEKLQLFQKLNITVKELSATIDELLEEHNKVKARMQFSDDAHVAVHNTIYPGTVIQFGRYKQPIKDAIKHCKFKLNKQEIVYRSIT